MSSARVSVSDGNMHIEVEGEPSFVEKHLKNLLPLIRDRVGDGGALLGGGLPNVEQGMQAGQGRQTLKNFLEQRSPQNAYEAIACVLFHYCATQERPELSSDEIRMALVQGKYSPPRNMAQAMTDCRRKYGYVDVGSKKGFWKLSRDGETLVEIDLPRKDN